jgi:hypothetical protein
VIKKAPEGAFYFGVTLLLRRVAFIQHIQFNRLNAGDLLQLLCQLQ